MKDTEEEYHFAHNASAYQQFPAILHECSTGESLNVIGERDIIKDYHLV